MAANVFFRYDTWIKSATGPAVAGAQIYVCNQPANVSSVPPSPLAAIFSDPNGLVPITQPIVADGFGHADFYALPGLYTVVVVYNGVIQSFFQDQSLGGIGTGGSGGTALLLQTNGVNNTVQTVLNIEGAKSVQVSSDNSGDITITGPLFQSNGVSNITQNKINLYSSDNSITITSDASGNVNLQASESLPTTQWFASAGWTTEVYILSLATGTFNDSTDIVAAQFVLDTGFVVNKVVIPAFGSNLTGSVGAAIYNASLTKVVDPGPITISNAQQVISVSPVTLPAGVYWFAWASTNNSASTVCFTPASANLTAYNAVNADTVRLGLNAFGYSGTMPSTLPTLTKVPQVISIPVIVFSNT